MPLLAVLMYSCSSVPEEISSEYYNIGNAYFDVGDYEKAIEYYMKALDDNHPMVNNIRFNLAVAYTESGRVTQGLELFDSLLIQDPDNMMVLQSKAYAFYLLGDDDNSLEVYNRILDVFEYNETALFNKALILMDSSVSEAQQALEKLFEVDKSAEVVLLLGKIYMEEEDRERYVSLFEEAVISNPGNSQLLKGLADYYREEGKYFKSIDYMDRLLAIDSYDGHADVLFEKAEMLFLDLNDYNNGFETLKRALDAGFDDRGRIGQLIDSDELSGDVQLRDYLELRGFL